MPTCPALRTAPPGPGLLLLLRWPGADLKDAPRLPAPCRHGHPVFPPSCLWPPPPTRQITDVVEEVTRASFCWGMEGKMSLLIHPGAGSVSGTVPCLSDG